MSDIFRLDNLAINSELELFNVVLEYVEVNKNQEPKVTTETQELLNENKEEPEKKNTLEDEKIISTPTIRDVIKNIRFLTLTTKQFADGPGNSDFLTKEESYAFFMKISSPESDFKIPDGFTTIKNTRNNVR